jgi:hypothetical protein
MLPTGDTKSHLALNWAFNQAAYVKGNDLLVLLVLTHHAFYKAENPEHAPVGQVLQAYSSSAALAAWTGLSVSTVKRTLTSLQCEHGYLTRQLRPGDGSPGSPPGVIRLYWTTQFDMIRASHREDQTALPPMFDPPPPRLRVIKFPTPQVGQGEPLK